LKRKLPLQEPNKKRLLEKQERPRKITKGTKKNLIRQRRSKLKQQRK